MVFNIFKLSNITNDLLTDVSGAKDNDLLLDLVDEEASTCQLKHLPAFTQAVPKDRRFHPILPVAEQDYFFPTNLNYLRFTLGQLCTILLSWIALFEMSVQVGVFVDLDGGDEFVVGVQLIDAEACSLGVFRKPKHFVLRASEQPATSFDTYSFCFDLGRSLFEVELTVNF